MKILFIQHSAADSPAAASEVLERPEHTLETIRIDRGDAIPESADADALMLFGGASSLAGSDRPAWVEPEQELIRRYVDAGRRVFGICFGSQMIANALGARVRRNREPEIGWHQIENVGAADEPSIIADVFPEQTTVLQWHQDTFEIPPGAKHLFRSQACENQGFTIDDRVFAFQFHLEANPRTVDIFLAVSNKQKQLAPFVQSESEIRAGMSRHLPSQTARLHRFIERWLGDSTPES